MFDIKEPIASSWVYWDIYHVPEVMPKTSHPLSYLFGLQYLLRLVVCQTLW